MSNTDTYGQERRRHPRTQLRLTLQGIRLDPDGGEVLDTLHMQDISKSGMGAVSDRPYYPGQRVVLSLPGTPGVGRRNLYARVVRCRPGSEGYNIGLEFDNFAAATTTGVPQWSFAAA